MKLFKVYLDSNTAQRQASAAMSSDVSQHLQINTPLIAPLQSMVKQYSEPDLAYVVDFNYYKGRHYFGEIFRVGVFLTLQNAIQYALSLCFLHPNGSIPNSYNRETRSWNVVNASSIVTRFTEAYNVVIRETVLDAPRFPKEALRSFSLTRGIFSYSYSYDQSCDEFDSIECYRDWKSSLDKLFTGIPRHICSSSGHIIRRSIEKPYYYDEFEHVCRVCGKMAVPDLSAEQEKTDYLISSYTGADILRVDYQCVSLVALQVVLVKPRLASK